MEKRIRPIAIAGMALALVTSFAACNDNSTSAPCSALAEAAGKCTRDVPTPTPAATPTPAPTPIPANGACPFAVSWIAAPVPHAFYVLTFPDGPTHWIVDGVNQPTPIGVLFNVPSGAIVTACRDGCGCLPPFPVI